MINELYALSGALRHSNVETQSWHPKYRAIPNITNKNPCVRITLEDGNVRRISKVDPSFQPILRKYGSNQGSYPCMNLAPLYRITDEVVKKALSAVKPEELDGAKLETLRSWCTENNWTGKFQKKYRLSMDKMAAELCSLAAQYEPLQVLVQQSKSLLEPALLHEELERTVWRMLERRESVSLALAVLFHQGKKEEKAEDDYGKLSVALESAALIKQGIPAVSEAFVTGLNACLLAVDEVAQGDAVDAFGVSFPSDKMNEKMPKVKLAGGFDVILRTMFKEQHCQYRYGKSEGASYPVAPQTRQTLQDALEWIGAPERKNVTWMSIGKDEILFVYSDVFQQEHLSYTGLFGGAQETQEDFEERTKAFVQTLRETKEPGKETTANRIQIFILRKIGKGHTKTVYTRQTDPYELERCSEAWSRGCTNLPAFSFGAPEVLYPLEIADVLNQFWKQDGEAAPVKGKAFPQYHGIELLLEPEHPVTAELHRVAENAMKLGAFLGNQRIQNRLKYPMWEHTKALLALMGLLLEREGIRKEDYMEHLPYLYGQLLKATDELHALYCNVVRDGKVPPELAGSSLFRTAAEAPVRTLHVLGQRIMPYYAWAKSYRFKGVTEEGKESWRARWLCSVYEEIVTKLRDCWTVQTRFNDAEKAQLFIGYLAAFPKREHTDAEEIEEVTTDGK